MGGISSLVGIGMHILGKQFTVFVHACCKVEFDRMTVLVLQKFLLC